MMIKNFKIIALGVLTFAIGACANAATYGAGYTYTNAPKSTATSSRPMPTCTPSKLFVAPNEKVLFVPKSPTTSPASSFMWRGEVSTTTKGPLTLSFIYPGQYTVVLRAIGFDGSYTETKCPQVSVSLNALSVPTTTKTTTYLFTFATTSTKALIPTEFTPVSKSCLNLGQNVSFGYSDNVSNPKDGVIYNLQAFLAKEGLLDSEPTGYFGPMTLGAVKAFQKSRGIESTGYVGPLTRAEIKSQTCLG